jgi:imidazolonepropionase-like amidohydrolase
LTASHPGYVIRAARVIDPATFDVLRDACIHVQDGRIAGRSSSAPAGVPVIDAGAAALLPGLIDCHTHLLLRPEDQVWPPAITFKTRPYRMAEGVAAARRALEIGFTSARDTGNEGAVHCDTALRQAIDAGIVPGPRLQVATDAISITAGDMTLVSEVNPELGLADPAAMADTRDEMIKQVRRQVKIGADWIKIYCTGTRKHVDPRTMEPLHQMTAEDVSVIVAEAARYRRDVAAHAYGGDGAQAAILGGARTLEHGPLLTEDDLQLLREHGTFWVPTLGTYHLRQHSDFDRRFVKRHEGAFRRALELGVRIAFGTDIGSYNHGQQMREFTLMVGYGMEPIAAIRSATTIAAEVLRLGGQIGTLADGARADLIAVDGDPVADIESLSRVHLVVKDGRVFRDDLGLAAKLPEAAWTPARLSPAAQVLLSDRLARSVRRARRPNRRTLVARRAGAGLQLHCRFGYGTAGECFLWAAGISLSINKLLRAPI